MSEKRIQHMKSRYGAHKSLRKTAEEFGVGKSTVHRKIKEKNMPLKKLEPTKVAPKKAVKNSAVLKTPKSAPSINKAPVKKSFKKKEF